MQHDSCSQVRKGKQLPSDSCFFFLEILSPSTLGTQSHGEPLVFKLTAQIRSKMTLSVARLVNGKPSDDFRPQSSSNPSWHQREQRGVIPTESCQNYKFMSKINIILSKKKLGVVCYVVTVSGVLSKLKWFCASKDIIKRMYRYPQTRGKYLQSIIWQRTYILHI